MELSISFSRSRNQLDPMTARYLIRFDDICPTMNWNVWEQIEATLLRWQIKPILAVVPDNHDPKLNAGQFRSDFWSRVREWQRRGWAIGLHGYQHVYVTQDAGIVGINPRSEFAGSDYVSQRRKINSAVEIFCAEKVAPKLWVAPAHSFDNTTLGVLDEFGIRCISDSFALYPYRDLSGRIWIPQQLWKFRDMPLGTWTICFHINEWSVRAIETFSENIEKFQSRITGVEELLSPSSKTFFTGPLMPRLFSTGYLPILKIKRSFGK